MKISILTKLITFCFIMLAGNGIIGYAIYKSNLKLRESEQWVQQTEQVISQAGNILSLGKDIETAPRGFVITNDSTFLEPLYIAEKTAFTSIMQLRQYTQDNHAQKQHIDSLSLYMHKCLDFSYQTVEVRKNLGLSAAIAYTSDKSGKRYIDHISQITNAIQLEETTLLKQRKLTNEASLAAFNWLIVIMFILMAVFTILLLIATGNIMLQNKEKEIRASELIIANNKLVFQNQEKEIREDELIIANKELAFQNQEKEKRATELIIANKELIFHSEEREKRASELIIANKELVFQKEEKEKRATELIIANKELDYQNDEKEKRASELFIANEELAFQNQEKEKRAFELIIANKELVFQNQEKEKRASELIIADKELVFQNQEKEKRASELIIADKELVFQNQEKEKQKAANRELEEFSYSVSHDLRAPLRHIGGFVDLLIRNNSSQLDETGLRYLNTVSESTHEMRNLIDGLLTFSRLSSADLQWTKINSKNLVNSVLKAFSDELAGRNIEINVSELPDINGDEDLINLVWVNLISNALKYSRNEEKAVITIGGKTENDKTIFYIKDNGAGFEMKYVGKLFGVFHRLHKARDFEGIGIGLANVNRIIMRHGGICWAEGEVGKGATFFFSLPVGLVSGI